MKSKRLVMVVLMVMMAFAMACSCNLLNGILNKDGATSAEENNADEAELGEEYRSEAGGFSFQKIPDYEFEEMMGIVQMAAPGANLQTGPGILFTGGLNTDKLTVDDAIANLKDSTPDYDYEKPKDIKVDGEDGVALDYTGVYEGQDVQGKIILVMVDDYQQFICVMVSPPEEWEEVVPLFESVLDTVEFFSPDPEAMFSDEEWAWEEEMTPTDETLAEPTEEPVVFENDDSQILRQWAAGAVASDQFGNDLWSAAQAIGEPDVDECVANGLAWAAKSSSSYAWLELSYPTPVNPTEINIYQSYNPSAVVEVDLITVDGEEYIAWTGYPESVDYCPDQMTITLDLYEPLSVNKVRVYIDQSYLNDWTEIDAVELVGWTAGSSHGNSQEQPQPVSGEDTSFSFGLTGCEETIITGTDVWISPDNQLIMLFDGGSLVVILPDDWQDYKNMELGAYLPGETPLPTSQIQFFDRDSIYATDSGNIWWDYTDATHISGLVDFYASEYDWVTHTLNSPLCQVGVWVLFGNVPLD